MGRYVAGQRVVIDFTFAEGDPGAVTVDMRKPDGTETDISANVANEPDVGAYSVFYDFVNDDPPGDYLFDIRGTGPVRGAVLWRVHLDDNGFVGS